MTSVARSGPNGFGCLNRPIRDGGPCGRTTPGDPGRSRGSKRPLGPGGASGRTTPGDPGRSRGSKRPLGLKVQVDWVDLVGRPGGLGGPSELENHVQVKPDRPRSVSLVDYVLKLTWCQNSLFTRGVS